MSKFVSKRAGLLIFATHSEARYRNGKLAVRYAERACRLSRDDPEPKLLATLGTAFAEAGRFSDAIYTATQALQLTQAQDQHRLASLLEHQISLYHESKPFRGTLE